MLIYLMVIMKMMMCFPNNSSDGAGRYFSIVHDVRMMMMFATTVMEALPIGRSVPTRLSPSTPRVVLAGSTSYIIIYIIGAEAWIWLFIAISICKQCMLAEQVLSIIFVPLFRLLYLRYGIDRIVFAGKFWQNKYHGTRIITMRSK